MSIGDLLQAAGNVAGIGPLCWGVVRRLSGRHAWRGKVAPAGTLTIELRTEETALFVSVTAYPYRQGRRRWCAVGGPRRHRPPGQLQPGEPRWGE
jgi:hypothetical protein